MAGAKHGQHQPCECCEPMVHLTEAAWGCRAKDRHQHQGRNRAGGGSAALSSWTLTSPSASKWQAPAAPASVWQCQAVQCHLLRLRRVVQWTALTHMLARPFAAAAGSQRLSVSTRQASFPASQCYDAASGGNVSLSSHLGYLGLRCALLHHARRRHGAGLNRPQWQPCHAYRPASSSGSSRHQLCPALTPDSAAGVCGPGPAAAAAHHAAQGHLRLHRALLWHPARKLRGRLPPLAGSSAGLPLPAALRCRV